MQGAKTEGSLVANVSSVALGVGNVRSRAQYVGCTGFKEYEMFADFGKGKINSLEDLNREGWTHSKTYEVADGTQLTDHVGNEGPVPATLRLHLGDFVWIVKELAVNPSQSEEQGQLCQANLSG